MPDRDAYSSMLDILSITKEAKDSLLIAKDCIAEAEKAIQSAEQLAVASILQGRRLVAFSEPDVDKMTDEQFRCAVAQAGRLADSQKG